MASIRIAGVDASTGGFASIRIAGVLAASPPSSSSYIRIAGVYTVSTNAQAFLRIAGVRSASTTDSAYIRIASVTITTGSPIWFLRTISGWDNALALNSL
jgi:hypothetical protein